MTPQQIVLNEALAAYGEAMVAYAETTGSDTYDSMVYWQERAWLCAKAVAESNIKGE